MAVIVETDTWKTGEHSHGEPLCYIVHGSNNGGGVHLEKQVGTDMESHCAILYMAVIMRGGGTPGKTGGHRHKILNHTKYLIAKM